MIMEKSYFFLKKIHSLIFLIAGRKYYIIRFDNKKKSTIILFYSGSHDKIA